MKIDISIGERDLLVTILGYIRLDHMLNGQTGTGDVIDAELGALLSKIQSAEEREESGGTWCQQCWGSPSRPCKNSEHDEDQITFKFSGSEGG
jgi:hypothetical protein